MTQQEQPYQSTVWELQGLARLGRGEGPPVRLVDRPCPRAPGRCVRVRGRDPSRPSHV